MKIKSFASKKKASAAAAAKAAEIISAAIKSKGQAVIVAASGKSQQPFLKFLTSSPALDWSKVILFHLDEFLGIPLAHRASISCYIKENIINKVNPGKFYLINGAAKNPRRECSKLNKIISRLDLDLVFLGIGENGHLAFNEPPGNFQSKLPFIIVKLHESTRKRQLREGLFSNLSSVPDAAISMSISQILKSRNIICLAFGKKKAQIIKSCFRDQVSPLFPASILQKHKNALLYLDKNSASLLLKRR